MHVADIFAREDDWVYVLQHEPRRVGDGIGVDSADPIDS